MKTGLSQSAVKRIAQAITKVYPEFDTAAFCNRAIDGLEDLELKARVEHIINALVAHLPAFEQAYPLLQALPDHWYADDNNTDNDNLSKFAAWPVIDYVARAGLDHPHWALPTLAKLTHLFSAEFAIRPFIAKYPEQTLEQMRIWAQADDEHIRRLASEGCRPRLPWGMQLKNYIANPSPLLPILETLNKDPSRYVQKSVANHLNDISTDHPDLVVDVCKRWQKENNKQTDWIIKHACRTLIKAGNPDCLALFGFGDVQISHAKIHNPKTVIKGHEIAFEFEFYAEEKQNLVIDYAIDFLRANGSHNRKVFKLKTLEAKALETVKLQKSYSFKAITTRRYYPGLHRVHLQINGKIMASTEFTLKDR